MGKKYKTKEVGILDKSFCKKYGLKDCINFKIVQLLGLIYHAQKHMNDFVSVDSFNITMLKIGTIISSPYFVFYDSSKNFLRYYKKLEEYVCVVVNITSTEAFVSTVYPVNKKTIDKLKK